jgi:hypothetical protein
MASDWALLGWTAIGTGQYELASDHLHKSTILAQELGKPSSLIFNLSLFAWREAKVGDINIALEWLGLCKSHEMYHHPGFKRFLDKILAVVRTSISDAEVEAALARGEELNLEQVLAEIIGDELPTTTAD